MAEAESGRSFNLENENYYYKRLSSDSFFLRKEFHSPSNSVSVDITGSRAIIGMAVIEGGELLFRTPEGDLLSPAGSFGMYFPPFSIYTTESSFDFARMDFLVTVDDRLTRVHDGPVLFPVDSSDFDCTSADAAALSELITSPGSVYLPLCSSTPALKIKAMIDNEFTELNSISGLAMRAGIEGWELSRLFKANFGISAIKYLNKLRTIEALYGLLENRRNLRIIDVAFNVGFRDLSRFNKQFKSCLRFIPRNLLGRG